MLSFIIPQCNSDKGQNRNFWPHECSPSCCIFGSFLCLWLRYRLACSCFIIIGVLGKRVKQQEKRMWKPRAWGKEATEEMSGFGKLPSPLRFLLACSLALSLAWFKDVVLSLGGQESQLKDERSKNEQLEEETDLLRRKAQLLHQVSVELKILLKLVWSFWQRHLAKMIGYLPTSSPLRRSQKDWKMITILKKIKKKNQLIRLMFCFLDSDWEWGAEGRSL